MFYCHVSLQVEESGWLSAQQRIWWPLKQNTRSQQQLGRWRTGRLPGCAATRRIAASKLLILMTLFCLEETGRSPNNCSRIFGLGDTVSRHLQSCQLSGAHVPPCPPCLPHREWCKSNIVYKVEEKHVVAVETCLSSWSANSLFVRGVRDLGGEVQVHLGTGWGRRHNRQL